jgi:CelD/BcsL family acetyltransferase involved in cellulose biosynthesis
MSAQALEITVERLDDFSGLAPLWLDLQGRSDGSFFQSWAWTGCLAEERFAEPWLLSARRGARVVALGLFNRGPRPRFGLSRPLLLGESGEPDRDSLFVEHNGLLTDRAESPDVAAQCWMALGESALRRTVWVLSGVPETAPAALPVRRRVKVLARRPAPYLDFGRLGGSDVPLLEHLSANSRQQLRRSFREWATIGDLSLSIAKSGDEADSYFNQLKILHQRYWTGRGQKGAFAAPFFERFHRALMLRAAAGQAVDVVRVTAGARVVGYLYNLIHDGWVASYQSGFDFAADADRLRPGLICHALAIDHYRRAGLLVYDFLGGEARYKRSLANAERALLWLTVRPK